MNTQFRKGVIEMCILALIERKDMYGYEIVQSIAYYTEIIAQYFVLHNT